MFAGDGSPQVGTHPQNVAAARHDALTRYGIVDIEGDHWMQVAVTGMGHVRDRQPIAFANGNGPRQGLGKLGAGHAAIDDITGGSQARQGAIRGSTTQPEVRRLFGAMRGANLDHGMLFTDVLDTVNGTLHPIV